MSRNDIWFIQSIWFNPRLALGYLRKHKSVRIPVTHPWRACVNVSRQSTMGWYSYNKNASLQWCQNYRDGVANPRSLDYLLSRLLMGTDQRKHQSSTGICERNPPVTGGFPSQKASNAEIIFHLMTSSWCISYVACASCREITTMVYKLGVSNATPEVL